MSRRPVPTQHIPALSIVLGMDGVAVQCYINQMWHFQGEKTVVYRDVNEVSLYTHLVFTETHRDQDQEVVLCVKVLTEAMAKMIASLAAEPINYYWLPSKRDHPPKFVEYSIINL